ncbi:CCA-adding enzyme [bacterium HR33]|nr:CCA-adding enzyme [bacterium HR33]
MDKARVGRGELRTPELRIPDEVLRIARRLEEAGYETWCVGGAIRDNLLGIPNADFDLATAAPPEVVRKLFRRTVPVGIEHGTVAVLDRNRQPHEVTTFRRDVVTDGRHAVVEFGASLEEDLARRDFTVNAIAYHPLRKEWRDPFGGREDLEAGLLRAVGDPDQRFREDYLRILRLLRFAARFGFKIDPATWEAARRNAGGLRLLSAERVRDEWFKGLESAERPSELVRLWRDVGAVPIWLPELGDASRDAVLDRFASRDPVLMTAYLSSDPAATLERLRCSNAAIDRGRRIGEHRGDWPDLASGASVRRWMSRVGSAVDDLLAIAAAEGREGAAELVAAVGEVRRSGAPLSVSDLAVNGRDLMQAGVPQGPEVGRMLRRLLDRVLEDPSANTREELLRMVREEYGKG